MSDDTELIPELKAFLMEQFGQDVFSLPAIQKALFRGSEAGISLHIVSNDTIIFTSIVENGDQEVTSNPLVWPFTQKQFWCTAGETNDEAVAIFNENEAEQEDL